MTATCTVQEIDQPDPTSWVSGLDCQVARGQVSFTRTNRPMKLIDSKYSVFVTVNLPSEAHPSVWRCKIGESGPAQGHGWPTTLTVVATGSTGTYSDDNGRYTGACVLY
ncbi:MAG: hypothetical protein HYX35_00085 [Proteobacteria bacterium]|nr:hypothetical protein [Pseudomonadota bacterium]